MHLRFPFWYKSKTTFWGDNGTIYQIREERRAVIYSFMQVYFRKIMRRWATNYTCTSFPVVHACLLINKGCFCSNTASVWRMKINHLFLIIARTLSELYSLFWLLREILKCPWLKRKFTSVYIIHAWSVLIFLTSFWRK